VYIHSKPAKKTFRDTCRESPQFFFHKSCFDM
jgi:hypothetical protein